MSHLKSKITIFITSLIAFIVALVLVYEKIANLINPTVAPSCSVNPLVSCTPVLTSWQGSLLGVPNPIYGIICFTLLCIISFFTIFMKMPKWVWLCTFLGVTFGFGLVIWFVSQSLFVIGAICIYCTSIWFMMIIAFWLTFAITIEELNWTKLNFVIRYKLQIITLCVMSLVLTMFFAFPDKWLAAFGLN
jgi:uncharacterized membrane protein